MWCKDMIRHAYEWQSLAASALTFALCPPLSSPPALARPLPLSACRRGAASRCLSLVCPFSCEQPHTLAYFRQNSRSGCLVLAIA